MPRSKTTKKAASTAATTITPTLDPALAARAPEAFAFVKAEILAIPEKELLPVNLDIPRAAGRGSLAAERIAPLLPELSLLAGFDIDRVARLDVYALALLHAHDLVIEVGVDKATLPALLELALPLREDMLRSSELLAHFGVVPAERVAAIRSGQGHADSADDLIALGRLFDEIWERVAGRTMVTREMVDQAPKLGAALHKALAQREVEESPLVPSSDRRYVQAQAFTLFARVYHQALRGVTYLRWNEGDAHCFVPSLYPHRPPRRGTAADDLTAADDGLDPGPAPAPTPVAETAAEALVANA
jgi:hypothetical protein